MQIQILLVDMPRMLRDMIEEAIAHQPDMHVLETVPDQHALVDAARRSHAEFVVFGIDEAEEDGFPRACIELLREAPHTRLLGVQATAGVAYLYELRPERRVIGEVAPDELVAAIRSAASDSWRN